MRQITTCFLFVAIAALSSSARATKPVDIDSTTAEATRLSNLAYEQQKDDRFDSAADAYEKAIALWNACLEADAEHAEAKKKLKFCESNLDYCLNRPLADEMRRADKLAADGQVREASDLYLKLADDYEQALARREKSMFRNNRQHCLGQAGRLPIQFADKCREERQLAEAADYYRLAIERYLLAHEKLGQERFAQNLKYARHHLSHVAFEHQLQNNLPAPNFELDTPAGSKLRLDDYRGKVVLVAFWAAWCGHCKNDLPMLDKLYREQAGNDFVVLGLCVDKAPGWQRGSAKKAEEMMAGQLTFPCAWADEATLQGFGSPDGVPHFIWIDAQGRLAGRGLGDERENLVRAKLQKVLERPQ